MNFLQYVFDFCELHRLDPWELSTSIKERDKAGLKCLILIFKNDLKLSNVQIASLLKISDEQLIDKAIKYNETDSTNQFRGKARIHHKKMIVEAQLKDVNHSVDSFFSNDRWEGLVRQQNNLKSRLKNYKQILRKIENGEPSHGYPEALIDELKVPGYDL